MSKYIYPDFSKNLKRKIKEERLNQKSKVLWFTGLSGSGKSAIALEVEKRLFEEGFITQILDGDNIRAGINNNLGFSLKDRDENIRRVAEISKLYLNTGIITLNALISPTKNCRALAKEIIGEENFIEIYINTPIAICEERDPKGLYKKARAGIIKNFTGIDSPYEVPESPQIEIKTDLLSVEESATKIYNYVKPMVQYQDS